MTKQQNYVPRVTPRKMSFERKHKLKSKTQPAGSLSVKQIIERFMAGTPVPGGRVGYFLSGDIDSVDLEKLAQMDLVEQHEVVRELERRLAEAEERKAALEKEQADAEEAAKRVALEREEDQKLLEAVKAQQRRQQAEGQQSDKSS